MYFCTTLILSTVCLMTAYYVELCTMFWVLIMFHAYIFCQLICLHWGSERNSISILSMSCTYDRTENKVDFDFFERSCKRYSNRICSSVTALHFMWKCFIAILVLSQKRVQHSFHQGVATSEHVLLKIHDLPCLVLQYLRGYCLQSEVSGKGHRRQQKWK